MVGDHGLQLSPAQSISSETKMVDIDDNLAIWSFLFDFMQLLKGTSWASGRLSWRAFKFVVLSLDQLDY